MYLNWEQYLRQNDENKIDFHSVGFPFQKCSGIVFTCFAPVAKITMSVSDWVTKVNV